MGRRLVVIVVAALATILGSATLIACSGSGDAEAVAVVLEPVNSTGTDPFTESVAIGEAALPETIQPAVPDGTTVTGGTPGLYGGTRDETVCDSDRLVEFLEGNPDKAAAWAGVLVIRPQEIEGYVAGLTPVVLTVDTRVTNHGFSEGRATSLQSVLQAGTAVLVDERGVPRVKCGCGNPLTEPSDVAAPAADAWPGYQPGDVVTVRPASRPVTSFTLTDTTTGETYQQPREGGAGGDEDAIRGVDFLNRFYRTHQPEESSPDWECSFGEVTLVNGKSGGEFLGADMSQAEVTYADVTGDGRDEALVALTNSGGSFHVTNNMIFGMRDGEAVELECVQGDVVTVSDDSRGVIAWTAISNGSISRGDATEYTKVTLQSSPESFEVASEETVPIAQFHAETGR
jgi:hypothetical protein